MSQAGLARVSSGNLPPSVPLQFTGDNGTTAVPAGNNITIYSNTPASGVSVSFVNSGSTSQLKLTDNRNNTLLGALAGPTGAYTGSTNVGVGAGSTNFTSGSNNVGVGYIALSLLTTGNNNVGVGDAALASLTTGHDNIAIGAGAGDFYSSNESNNIAIGDTGSPGDQGIIYLGTQGTQTKCFVAGITGVSVANTRLMSINNTTGQVGVISPTANSVLTTNNALIPTYIPLTNGQVIIGSTVGAPLAANLTAGSGISISNGANSITISATSAGVTWTDVTSATQTLAAQSGYVTDRGAGVTYTLPASGTLGDMIKIVGKLGLATITPNANQQILVGSASGTVGVTGTCVSNNVGDCINLICITAGASTVWRADNLVGTWTLN